jgi:hypothetical protein
MKKLILLLTILLISCASNNQISFKVIDTDFSKGRLINKQKINLNDLKNFMDIYVMVWSLVQWQSNK